MSEFKFWGALFVWIFLLVSGIRGVIEDKKIKAQWWRWALDCLSISVSIYFIIDMVC